MHNPSKNLTSAYLALAFGVVCIACSAIFVKFAALPGPTSAFYRVLFAAVIAVPWWLWKRSSRPSFNAVILTLAGGLFFAIELVLWQVALLVTSAANATLLVNIAPVWVGLGALLIFREKLGPYFWGGLAIAFVGMVFVVSSGTKQLASFNYGDILAIGGSFFYALYLLVTQKIRAEMDTLTFLALSVTSSVVVLLATCLMLGSPLSGFSTQAWLSLAALGLFSHLGGYLAINYALGHLRASSVSVSLLGQPVITALLSIPLLGEGLSVPQMIGGIIVLVGVYLVNCRTSPKQEETLSTRDAIPLSSWPREN